MENPDILATIAHRKSGRPPLVIGFAAETDNVIANAKAKLAKKGCDWIVANDVSPATGIMGGDSNTVHLVTADGVEVVAAAIEGRRRARADRADCRRRLRRSEAVSGDERVEVRIMRLPHGADLPLPQYQSALAAGLDLLAAVPADAPVALAPGARALIPTGVAMALPPGNEGQVRPRSGLAARHGVTVLNTPGTVDADYRGEVQVILVNLGTEPFIVQRGMRIAQFVIAAVARTLAGRNQRARSNRAARHGGFGSTGDKLNESAIGIVRDDAQCMPRTIPPISTFSVCVCLYSRAKLLLAIAAVVDVALQGDGRPISAKTLGNAPRLAAAASGTGAAVAGARRYPQRHPRPARRL